MRDCATGRCLLVLVLVLVLVLLFLLVDCCRCFRCGISSTFDSLLSAPLFLLCFFSSLLFSVRLLLRRRVADCVKSESSKEGTTVARVRERSVEGESIERVLRQSIEREGGREGES